MERDGCDEMKSSKVVVKGLGRVIEAASFNLHHEGIWRSFSSIKYPLGCEKLAVHKEYGDEKGCNELFRMVPAHLSYIIWYSCSCPFFRLLGDPDEDAQEQAFNVVRNLTESEDGIAIFKEIGKEVLSCVMAKFWERQLCSLGKLTFFFYDLKKKKNIFTDTYTCSLGGLCTRRHVQWNIRTTRSDSLLPQPPFSSPSLSFGS